MKLAILCLALSTVLTQDFTCPPPPDNCTLPCAAFLCSSCQNPCPATCDNPNPVPLLTNQCNCGCYQICPEGYVFTKIGGFCVPLEDCPTVPHCRHSEQLVQIRCGGALCGVQFCSGSVGFCNELCFPPLTGPLVCQCKDGFIRDGNYTNFGNCVKPVSPSCLRDQTPNIF